MAKTKTKKAKTKTENLPIVWDQEKFKQYQKVMLEKVAAIDPHRPSAWGARPLFRLRLTDARTSIGFFLIDVIAITSIPNTNKAHTKSFKASSPKPGSGSEQYYDETTWHCLCFSESDSEGEWSWSEMAFSGEDRWDISEFYEVVS